MNEEFEKLKCYWFVACRSEELKKKPYACMILSVPVVLFRSGNEVVALEDRCPHRNVPLSSGAIKKDNIECPYHGWQFNKDGTCEKIPGLCKTNSTHKYKVAKFEAIEDIGFIWVKLSKSDHPIYVPKLYKNNNYYSFILDAEANGSLLNGLENFLDGTHTHYVHNGIVRSQESERQLITAIVEKASNNVQIKYTNETNQSGIISKLFESNRADSYGRFYMPSIAELEYCSSSGIELYITAYFTPVSENYFKTSAVLFVKNGYTPNFIKKLILTFFFRRIIEQDAKILEIQQKNIKIFGKEKFHHSNVDLIRPHIISLLSGNTKTVKKSIKLYL